MLLLKRAAALFVVAVALPYLVTPAYRFPPPQRFRGERLWNPYAQLSGTWQLTNLHAHGRAWGGLTNGRQSDAEVVQAYEQRGYTVAAISNYQQIPAGNGGLTMPIYEHGYNLTKRHQLGVGARSVDWFDLPLWHTASDTQHVIERLRRTVELVAVAHPWTVEVDVFSWLTGYHLLVLVCGPFWADAQWDTALSSGHPVWAIANDDTHDVNDPRRMHVAWTMVDAPSARPAEVIAALRAGRMYAVSTPKGRPAQPEAALKRFDLNGPTIDVASEGTPATYVFIGQDGVVRKEVEWTNSASYSLVPDDSYIRTEIRTPNQVMFLNPVIRHDGAALALPEVTVSTARTWARRLLVRASSGAFAFVLWRRPRGTREGDVSRRRG